MRFAINERQFAQSVARMLGILRYGGKTVQIKLTDEVKLRKLEELLPGQIICAALPKCQS
jgi:hypothetical protein